MLDAVDELDAQLTRPARRGRRDLGGRPGGRGQGRGQHDIDGLDLLLQQREGPARPASVLGSHHQVLAAQRQLEGPGCLPNHIAVDLHRGDERVARLVANTDPDRGLPRCRLKDHRVLRPLLHHDPLPLPLPAGIGNEDIVGSRLYLPPCPRLAVLAIDLQGQPLRLRPRAEPTETW